MTPVDSAGEAECSIFNHGHEAQCAGAPMKETERAATAACLDGKGQD